MKKVLNFVRCIFQILLTGVKRYHADQHNQRAVALTYHTLFAIVPLAALIFGIAKGFDIETKLRLVLDERFAHHRELLKYVYNFADTTLRQSSGGLVAGVGVIALIWTVMWLAGNIEKSFNAVWGLPARKNILRKFSDYLAIVLLLPILLVLLSSAGVFLRAFFNRLGSRFALLSGYTPGIIDFAGNLMPLVVVIVLFTLIYWSAPNTKVRLLPALFAGIVAGICFQLLQDLFIHLQGSLYRYNRIYGSFAALPLFLIWMQWSWQIVLFGAEIGFVAQQLNTGLFDDTHESLPPRSHRLIQLALSAEIYRNFEQGKGGVTAEELLEKVNISAIHLNRELLTLERAGIILRLSEKRGKTGCCVPALPPEKTTVADCCRMLDLATPESQPAVGGTESAEKILAEFDALMRESAGNLKIFEL